MKKTTSCDQRSRKIVAIEDAQAETCADIAAGRVARESAEAHIKQLNTLTLSNDSTYMLTQRDFEAFTSAVEKPPKPKMALRKLMARK